MYRGEKILNTNDTSTLPKLLDICVGGKYHKVKPSSELSEEGLAGECSKWSGRACCSKETALAINNLNVKWHSFDLEHCDGPISAKCKRHFVRDNCFFECSPNVGPWIRRLDGQKKHSSEKFFDVPLCASECDAWWSDCKEDMTCTDNWYYGFKWVNGTNTCKNDCKSFEAIFQNAKNFCQKVWYHSYKYVPANSDEPCFKLEFEPRADGSNPNDEVAKYYVRLI
ncbi:unnamed protein product [Gordionus sp. m RMFG-2023]